MSIFDKKEGRQVTKKEFDKARDKARRSEEKDNRKAEKEFQKKEGWKPKKQRA
jgi:hypothetical protein